MHIGVYETANTSKTREMHMKISITHKIHLSDKDIVLGKCISL